MYYNFFIFGDSIAYGCYDSAGGWAQRIGNFLQHRYLAGKEPEIFTYNLSTHSQTTADILARLEAEIKPRLFRDWKSEGDIIIFAVGLNDSAFVHSKNDNWVNFNNFKNNIKELVVKASKFSKRIIFVGLAPVDQAIVDPMPFDLDKSYREIEIKRYDSALRELAKNFGAGYIPIYDKFVAADHKKLLHDGAHPNSAGHQLIFETVRDYLLEKKII